MKEVTKCKMLEVQTAGSNQIWVDKFPLLIFLHKYTDVIFKNSDNVLDQYKSFPYLKWQSVDQWNRGTL